MRKENQIITFICKECGYESLKWLGKCPQCKSWNSFTEFKPSKLEKIQITSFSSELLNLSEINLKQKEIRIFTNIQEFDRLLGGGIVVGSVVLIGGEPGVGKSTLMLQIADKIANFNITENNNKKLKVLYVTGEESFYQVKLRADRLNINNPNIFILSETLLEKIIEIIESREFNFVIIDSIQTIYSENIPATQGSIAQIKGVTAEIIKLAKNKEITIFVLGHITKEGDIAGPKLLEHMVDTVLYFETETTQNYRILRVYKNRFGPSSEIAIFEMSNSGLKEIKNPSDFFIHHSNNLIGTVTTCIVEGTKPLLTQIQALLTKTYFQYPRRVVTGIDSNRAMMLISVLEKYTGINLVYEDIYLNIVSGLKTKEPVIDLPIIVAIYSSYKEIVIDTKVVYMGEVGLNGELRAISFVNERLNEINKLGYKKVFLPLENKKNIKNLNSFNIQIEFISSVREIEKIF